MATTDLFFSTFFMIQECVHCLFLLGGTDGTGCVTPNNIGGKPAHSQLIFSGARQRDDGSGRNKPAMTCHYFNSASPICVHQEHQWRIECLFCEDSQVNPLN